VLALLTEGPSHGYDLKDEFDNLTGPHFGTLNIGHLYQLLERLARDGLAETHREPQDTRPDRLIYTLTDKGRAELTDWLVQSPRPASGYRDEFFLKLGAARRLGDPERIRHIITNRRLTLLQELRDLAALRAAAGTTTYDRLLTSAAELHNRSLLDLLDQIETAIPQLVAEAEPRHPRNAISKTAPTMPPRVDQPTRAKRSA